jgi:type I restriction enzyme S subunit
MEKELPKNWVETELGNLITLMNGYAFKSTDYSDVGIPIIRMSDIENNEINILKSVRVAQKKGI